jgi:hypothetical protein
MRAVAAYRIGFWDAMLWAIARRAGVRILFSEDFQDRQTIQGRPHSQSFRSAQRRADRVGSAPISSPGLVVVERMSGA